MRDPISTAVHQSAAADAVGPVQAHQHVGPNERTVVGGSWESDMTKLLEKAFSEAAKLPAAEQDALATAVLSEIDADRRWDRLFAESEDLLRELAEEALVESRTGKTKPLDPDRL